MTVTPLSAYALSIVALAAKFVVTVCLQGLVRRRHGIYRYPEDAAHFGGTAPPKEHELVARAQRVLNNDAEGQLWFAVLGALYVALGAWPTAAPWYFGSYVVSRWVHAGFLLWPRQPARTQSYGLGLGVLLVIAGHVAVAAF